MAVEALALAAVSLKSGTASLEDERLAQRQRRSLFNAVLRRQDGLVRRGSFKTFEVEDAHSLRLRWATVGNDPLKKVRIALRATAANWLDELTDRQYEFAGGLMLQILGASDVHVTPHGSEFGVDFFGRVPAYSKSPLFISGADGVRVVGQAKQYAGPVTREKIQAFNNCLDSIRHNRGELNTIIPPWFRASKAPIVGCFISHVGFQDGAEQMCSQNGYVMLDSLHMAEMLADPKRFAFKTDTVEVERVLWEGIRRLGYH